MQMPDFTAFPVKSGIFCSLQRVKKVCVIPRERMSPVRQSAPQNLPKRHAVTVFRLRIEKTVIARALAPVAIRTQKCSVFPVISVKSACTKENGLPHQCAHWFAMTGSGQFI